MTGFSILSGIAVPFPISNIDTDQLAPRDVLKIVRREGLGDRLFEDQRYLSDSQPNPDFILNTPPFNAAKIIVAGANFGCGSSREHAVWALIDFGITCVLAPSFSDIFRGNSAKNGLLAAQVDPSDWAKIIDHVSADAASGLQVDLPNQIVVAGENSFKFEVDEYSKYLLENAYAEIDMTLLAQADIEAYENARRVREPWFIPGHRETDGSVTKK